jgi:predicted nucleic acid-binding protein
MRVVFADAGYWIALANPRDEFHERALTVSASLGKFRVALLRD